MFQRPNTALRGLVWSCFLVAPFTCVLAGGAADRIAAGPRGRDLPFMDSERVVLDHATEITGPPLRSTQSSQ